MKTPSLTGGSKSLKLWVEKNNLQSIIRLRSANLTIKNKGGIVMKRDDISSLAHSKWNCKYHVVFAPKYRRMVIYNQIKTDIGKILRKLCEHISAKIKLSQLREK